MSTNTQINTINLPNKTMELLQLIFVSSPLQEKAILQSLGNATKTELDYLDNYLYYCEKNNLTMPYIAECYLLIIEDMMREQLYFLKNKKYRFSTFDEVADSVYFNDEYMNKYMYGLALTTFFWKNHVKIQRFFNDSLPKQMPGKYLEIGPGHGFSFMNAMRMANFDSYTGIDISNSSVQITKDLITHFVPDYEAKADLKVLDFFNCDSLAIGSFSAIVMGEVLEHVERPEAFLLRISELIKKNGFIFLTTCFNSPAIDHIFLWRNSAVLEALIGNSGLTIVESLYLPYQGMTLEQSFERNLSVNVAYILKKTT